MLHSLSLITAKNINRKFSSSVKKYICFRETLTQDKKTKISHLHHTADLCAIAEGKVFSYTDNPDVHAQSLTHARKHNTPYQCTHTRAHIGYSKRCNGLINNASALHVYAIYRARPSDGYCRCEPAHTRRIAFYKPITHTAWALKLKSFPPVEKEIKIIKQSSARTC